MSVIAIPRSIRERLGDEASEDFATLINDIDLGARKDAIAIAAERFERRLVEETGKLRVEISKVNERISVEIGNVNERISEESGKLRVEISKVNERISEETGRLRAEIANCKAEIIKWMFLFWIGQTAVMVALFKFFVVK
ncbi:MAG: DUF1640 domain-containing protein [Nitrospirae bacterium]|nr:DUF1640 domain-containing protein [Nitrospirota bacterium]